MTDKGFIYLIRATDSGRVKLGFSRNPKRRFKNLNAASHEDLKLIALLPGCYQWQERGMHAMLAKARVKNEWYASLEAIEAIASAYAADIQDDDEALSA